MDQHLHEADPGHRIEGGAAGRQPEPHGTIGGAGQKQRRPYHCPGLTATCAQKRAYRQSLWLGKRELLMACHSAANPDSVPCSVEVRKLPIGAPATGRNRPLRFVVRASLHIFSLTPAAMSHKLTGYAVAKPQSIAICIMNQNSTVFVVSLIPIRCPKR